MELTNKEMSEISGGGISWGVAAFIGAGLVYIIGFFGGYTNPERCKN